MGLFIFLFICNLLIPLIMIIAGYFMYKNPPKEINNVFGYRTRMSKKNKDTWVFAHDYCGRLWIKLGFAILIITILAQIPFVNSNDQTFGNITLVIEAVQLIFLLGSIALVEKALRRTFDENGDRI